MCENCCGVFASALSDASSPTQVLHTTYLYCMYALREVQDKGFNTTKIYHVSGRSGGYLPPANEVWGKVMFLHLSVILFIGGVPGPRGGGCLVPGGLVSAWKVPGPGPGPASYWNSFLFNVRIITPGWGGGWKMVAHKNDTPCLLSDQLLC